MVNLFGSLLNDLNDMVNPLQSSFMLEKGTINNEIIFREFVYHMRKSKKKNGKVIYMVDLEKLMIE